MVWRFQVKEIGETQALPLAFLCILDVLSKSSTHLFSAATAELEERKRRRYHTIKATAPCFIYVFQFVNSSSDI